MTRTIRTLAIAVIAILAAAQAGAAGKTQYTPHDMKKLQGAELNYINALVIGNDGAKISAAGFLADYRMAGAVPALIAVLQTDKAENVRISAALALIMLDEKDGRAAVEDAALFDGSDRVARFCDALLQAHSDKGEAIAEQ